jgi:hypothetical protein
VSVLAVLDGKLVFVDRKGLEHLLGCLLDAVHVGVVFLEVWVYLVYLLQVVAFSHLLSLLWWSWLMIHAFDISVFVHIRAAYKIVSHLTTTFLPEVFLSPIVFFIEFLVVIPPLQHVVYLLFQPAYLLFYIFFWVFLGCRLFCILIVLLVVVMVASFWCTLTII